MRVEIVVDELLLEGFDPRDRLRIADALEREIAAATMPRDVLALAHGDRSRDALAPINVTLAARDHGSSRDTSGIARSVGGGIAAALARPGVGTGRNGRR